MPTPAGPAPSCWPRRPGGPLEPRFGPGSAAAHLAAGVRRLDGPWPRLRRDVDTAADLAAARRLGLGRHSAGALASTDPCAVSH